MHFYYYQGWRQTLVEYLSFKTKDNKLWSKIQLYLKVSRHFTVQPWLMAADLGGLGVGGRGPLLSSTYLSSSLSFWQFPRKFPNWHECTCSWIWRRNASLNSKACGNCSVRCHTHSKNWVNTGETSFGSPSRWPHLAPPQESTCF